MIVCLMLVRFELVVAAGGRALLLRHPAALAPRPGDGQHVGEASPAAEAFGVRAGMGLGEALARCPQLSLIPPDPAGVAEAWEDVLARLEAIGAEVAPERPGLACFDGRRLRVLHGGRLEGVVEAARRAIRRSAADAGHPARLGAAASRFCAVAAAGRARAGARRGRVEIVGGGEAGARAYLAPLPVGLLGLREETAGLPVALERLGVRTLGELSRLCRAALADRFGRAGLVAQDLASGRDRPLAPRRPPERLEESLELPEAAAGPSLEHALGLLVDRLVARRQRRGRTLRAVVLSARLVEGGTWRERVIFGEALADPVRMRLAVSPRLSLLPAPAQSLRLGVERFGPPVTDQRALLDEAAHERDARLREAVRQARALAGPDAALRVVEVEPRSRVPERRAMLGPYAE
jgi:nucleotidyltransferase/DNA polymerase involved in DNA repair